MADMTHWYVHCADEATDVDAGWSTAAPTECPNDAGHSIACVLPVETAHEEIHMTDGTNVWKYTVDASGDWVKTLLTT